MLRHQGKSCNDNRQPTFLESERLRQEVEDLEDALILHARYQSESDSSVKEMIRKELGTTHWEHGGEGKLTTYRSGKDLCNQGMRMHPCVHKKAKDMRKPCTVLGDKDDDRPKGDKEKSNASMCAAADKKARKLKRIKSALDKEKPRDIMSDVEKMSELKITSIKATAAIKESCEMTLDTADVKQDAITKAPSLKDEISIIRKEKSCLKKTNYRSKLHVNTVERKQSKTSCNNSIPESSNVLDTCKITTKEMTKTSKKMFHKKSVSQFCTQDTGDNFTSGIQPSFNSTGTNNVVTKIKLNTQELDCRIDTDKTFMPEAVNHTNISDNNKLINQLFNNDHEYSKSKILVGNVYCNINSYDDSRFLSSNQDKRVDHKDKWAEKNSGVLFIDSDYIRVPCSSSGTDGGCGDILTDLDALEDPQTLLHEGCEHACLSNADSCTKDKQQKKTNQKMLSFKDSFNMLNTTREELSAVQPSVTSLTNIETDNVNIRSELASSQSKCLNDGQVDSEPLRALLRADMSVTQQRIVSDTSSSLPDTDFPQANPSHAMDVVSWLHSLGLDSVEHYVQLFHDHQLDMSRVQFLSASDLREMGIHALGPIMKIMKGVLVLGRDRDKGLLCGTSDYTKNGDKQRQYEDMDNHIDTCDLTQMTANCSHGLKNHIDTFGLTKMSTKCYHDFNNGSDNNDMCKLEHSHSKTCPKTLMSPILHTKGPGQGAVVNNLDDNRLAKQNTTADLKISTDDSDAVLGVSHVVEGVLEENSKPHVVEGMLAENSRPKSTVNRRQAPVNRRAKQAVLGVSGQLPFNSKGIAVPAHKSHMREKQIRVKEANGRIMMRQKQLQDSELCRAAVGQRNEKDGLDLALLDVCQVQSNLSVPEKQSAEPNFRTLQQPCLEQVNLEPPRCLHSVELSQVNNCRSDNELVSPTSAKRRNAQERKRQKDNARRGNIIEEEKPVSVKAYADGDNQTQKRSIASSQYKDLQYRQELPGQGHFNSRVNESLRERNGKYFISSVAVGDGVIATDSAEIQKDATAAQPVTLMAATTRLLKSKRSRHASVRNKDNGQIRRQQSKEPEKYKRAGSSRNCILDSIKTMELNRNDVMFCDTDQWGNPGSQLSMCVKLFSETRLCCAYLLGSGTFSQVFKGTYQGSEVAVKRLHIPLQTRDLNYFVSGISILQELRHPHVAMLLGVCSRGDEFPLLVMEFLACGSLHTWLHDPSRTDLKRDEFYQIVRDVSAGMLYLHHHQPPVLHLDLKPRNILIGHGARAKVADFGFSKLRLQDGVTAHRTRESLTWMAPELFTSGEITPKADVYSFAMVLWEMVTRQCPYDNFSIFQVLEHVRTNRRPTLPSDCPKGLSQMVQKCWNQNPAARPGFKEIVKCLEQLSQMSEWVTSPETAAKPENEVMSLNFTPEYSRITEYSLKEGLLRAKEKTSDIDHIDLISLSSQDYEESNSYNDDESGCLQDTKGNDPEKSRFCDIISLTDSRCGIQAFSDSKSSLSSTDIEQPRLSLQFGCNSPRSCVSLPDNEQDNEKLGHNTSDQLNEMCLISRKPSISVSKSQDNLQSSMSVKKLLPLRHSLDRSKVMPASLQGKSFKPQRFLNHQTKSQISHHFLDKDVPGRMCKYVDTGSDSVRDLALVGSMELITGQDTLDCISINEDVLLAPCSEAFHYVPSFHDKVAPVRLTTRQEPSELHAGCCHESSNKDHSGNHLKELLTSSHVETQPVNIFMKYQSENNDHASIKAHEIRSGACDLDLGITKSCRMRVMNKGSQIQIASPLDQATMCSVVLNTHKSKQVEPDTYHFLGNNIAYEKENSPDRKMADVCLLAQTSTRSSNTRTSTKYNNTQASTKSSNIQASTESNNTQTSTKPSNIQASTKSNNIQTASVGSDNIPFSSRSDDLQISAKSGNIPTHSVKCYSPQIPVVIPDNVHVPSARSDNIQTLATLRDTAGFSEVIGNCTKPNNYRTSRMHGHETTTYESDSDSSTMSDISQDSLNKDAATSPRAVKMLDPGDLTRSSALVMNAGIILKNKINDLPIADNKNTESSSAYNPCLTDNQGLNAHHTCLQSEQENRNDVTEMSSTDVEANKCNKIHNTDDNHDSLRPEVRKSCQLRSFELFKSHEKTLLEDILPREKQKPNLTESRKELQVEEAAKYNLVTIPSSQKQHFLTELQPGIGDHVSDMPHKANEAKGVLSPHSKQIVKNSEDTSRFSIDANILLSQKKLLKPVVTTASSLSVNTCNDSEGTSPTVITILKKITREELCESCADVVLS